MQRYFAASAIVLRIGMVWFRVLLMRRKGIKAMKFRSIDKKDFLVPPFALFYFYVVFAAAFHFPTVSRQEFFHSGIVSWAGVLLCLAGLFLPFLRLVSFGRSFRVGIDPDQPDKLVTTGIFTFSRNPILCGIWICFAGAVSGVLELDSFDLYRRRSMADPPSGIA